MPVEILKPRPWAVRPALVEEEFRGYWARLGFAWCPLSRYDVLDYANRIPASELLGAWSTYFGGPAVNLAVQADDLEWPAGLWAIDGDQDFTIFLAFDQTGTTQFIQVYWELRNGTAAAGGDWRVIRSGSDLQLQHLTDGPTANTATFAGASTSNGFHTLCLQRRRGGTAEAWVDGVQQASQSLAGTPILRSRELRVGGADGSNRVLGHYSAVYLWPGRALTDAEVRRLNDDPWGPLRPARHVPVDQVILT